jgi:hypothetical protein
MTAKGVGSNINKPDHIFPLRMMSDSFHPEYPELFFYAEESILE